MGKNSKKSPHDLRKAAKRAAADASTSRVAAAVDGTGLEGVEVISIPSDAETEEKRRRKSSSNSQSEKKIEDDRRTKKKHRKHKKAAKEKKRSRKKFKKLIKEILAQSTEATNLDKELDNERSSEYKECSTRKNDDNLDDNELKRESKRNKSGEADESGNSRRNHDKRKSHVNRSSPSHDRSVSQSCADNASSPQKSLEKKSSPPRTSGDSWSSSRKLYDDKNNSQPRSYYNMISSPQKMFDKRKSSSRSSSESSPQRNFKKRKSSPQRSSDKRKSGERSDNRRNPSPPKSYYNMISSPQRSCDKRSSSRSSADDISSPQRSFEKKKSSPQKSHDDRKCSRKKSYDDRKSSPQRNCDKRNSSRNSADNGNSPQRNSKLETRTSSPQKKSRDNGKSSRKKSYDDKRSSSRSSADSSSSPQKRSKARKSSPQRSHDNRESSRKISYDDKRSSPRRSCDKRNSSRSSAEKGNLSQGNSKLETRRSSPQRSHDNRKRSRKKSYDDRKSSPQRSSSRSSADSSSSPQKRLETRKSSLPRTHDNRKSSREISYDDGRSSPQRNSGGKIEQGTTRSWDRRGSSSEREDVSKKYYKSTHSKDRPEVAKEIEADFFFARPKEHPLLPRCIALGVNVTTAVKSRTNMGKKSGNKKPKFRAVDVQKLEEEDKKVTASTSRTAATADGGTGHEAVVDIPLPSSEPERSPAANCQTVQNKEDEHHSGKVQSRHRTKPNQNEPPKVDASQSNESRSRKWGPRVRSKERPKDTAGCNTTTTSGTSAWGNEGQGQSRLNINAEPFEPSSSGRTTQNWDSATDDNSEAKFPLEDVQNFNQAVDHKPQMNWAEAMTREEKQSQADFKEPIEEITDHWPKATNLDSEQDNNEQSWRQQSASKNDNVWRTESRHKHGEADGGNRRSHDKRRSHDNRKSPQRSNYNRSSPQRGYDNMKHSPQRKSSDNRRNSSPQRNYDNRRNSPSRNSYGGGRGEGATPSWGERGSSSERDGEFREYCNLARSKDRAEFVKVKEIEGDLFAQPKEYSLAHCVAEDMGMGSGIAVQFRRDFKRVDELLNQRVRQGGLAVLDDGDRYIYYLVTKKASNGKPTNHTLFCSLKKLRQHMLDNKITKLAIPRIGCGLDRLEWSHVKLMVEFLFRNADVEIVVCNYQQDENVPPPKVKRGLLVKYEKPIQNIEDSTIIIYTTSTEDDDTSQEMRELDKKFPSLLVQFRNSLRRPGMAIAYDKNPGYRLYGCVVRRKKSDPFDYVEFQKCIGAIEKDNRKLGFYYVAFQALTDPKDDMINDKVVNIVRNGMRNVDVYVCPSPE